MRSSNWRLTCNFECFWPSAQFRTIKNLLSITHDNFRLNFRRFLLDYSDGNGDASGRESEGEDNVEKERKDKSHDEAQEKIETTTAEVVASRTTCDTDHGCEHECFMVKYDYETHMIVQW